MWRPVVEATFRIPFCDHESVWSAYRSGKWLEFQNESNGDVSLGDQATLPIPSALGLLRAA